MSSYSKNWLRPVLFLRNNPISPISGAITIASARTLIGFWVVAVVGHGGSNNPYLGIIFDLCLPSISILSMAP